MNYYIPEIPLQENNEFSIYGVSELNEYANDVMKYMLEIKKNILQFFGLNNYDKVRINLYDNKDNILKWRIQFGNAPYNIGNNAGFFYNNMVFCYSDLSKVSCESAIKNIAHEFVHLVYVNCVQEKGTDTRTVWVDEGLAQFLSGQKNELLDDNKFREWFKEHIINSDKEIPKIEFLKQHGSDYGTFCDIKTNKYNGYDISYVLIRYLIETLPPSEFQSIIRSKKLIEQQEKEIMSNAISYYINKFRFNYKK